LRAGAHLVRGKKLVLARPADSTIFP